MADIPQLAGQGWPANLFVAKVTISTAADGASEVLNVGAKAIVGLIMPASWTAAALQWYGALTMNANDLKALKDTTTGNLMQTLVAADDWIVFPLADAYFGPYVQLRSVTAGGVVPVVQGASREILLLMRNLFD